MAGQKKTMTMRKQKAGPHAIPAALTAIAILATGVSGLALTTNNAHAKSKIVRISALQNANVRVAKGKPQTVQTDTSFYEIVIGDPEIANVNPLTDRSFYVLGNKLGTTAIALFDANKQLVGTVDIEVSLDADGLATTIQKSLPDSNIKVDTANGRVILSGKAADAVDADKAKKIATNFSGAEEIINSVDIASSQQVQLNVRILEINRTAGVELGTRLGFLYNAGGNTIGFNTGPSTHVTPISSILNGAFVAGNFNIDVAIRALEDKGLARRLAQPNLIARSGQPASFLAGGEVPIPVASDSDANGDRTVTVEYKKFGVSLDFTPTVLKGGLITLDVAPEVSAIDRSESFSIGAGINIPSFIVRRASTSIDLKSGQSFMMAGLLQNYSEQTTDRVPGLGKLSVIGALFSSKAFQRRETELVVIVTPHLIKPIDPSKKIVSPLDNSPAMSDQDYFLGNVDEFKVSDIDRAKASARVNKVAGPKMGHFLKLEAE